MVADGQDRSIHCAKENEVVCQAKAMDEPGLRVRQLVGGVIDDSRHQTAEAVGFDCAQESAVTNGLEQHSELELSRSGRAYAPVRQAVLLAGCHAERS